MTPTTDEMEMTEQVREHLCRLGRAITANENIADAREALELMGVKLSATDSPSDFTNFASTGEVMVVAHYGRCRRPMLARTDSPDVWAAKFQRYTEPRQASA